MAVYYATKAYVLHFSEALNQELTGSGVQVTALCPGPTATQFSATAQAGSSGLFNGKLPSPEQVAAYGYKAMRAGKPVAIYGLRNKSVVFIIRFLPRKLVTRLIAHIQQ